MPKPLKSKEEVLSLLIESRRLMRLNEENPFKIRAFEKAADILEGQNDVIKRLEAGTLTELPGIGKGIDEVLQEFVFQGTTTMRDELIAQLPEGLVELVRIPSLGPKRARQLIEQLEVKSLGELEYACQENRLLKLKGFGEKAQAKLLEAIQFLKRSQGRARLVDAMAFAEGFLDRLRADGWRVEETGELRRRVEVVSRLEFLVEASSQAKQKQFLTFSTSLEQEFRAPTELVYYFSSQKNWGYEWARTTASAPHWKVLGEPAKIAVADEEVLYEKLERPWVSPELREGGKEFQASVLPWDGIQGVFHNHTRYSDGTATVDQMVEEARRLGYRYIGFSDHSQSAVYAQGLKSDDLKKQEKEIQKAREKYPDMKIFWGIESDILKDGSLDYPDSILKRFDFVIASVHARFKANKKEMTKRLVEAIKNQHTRMLGHMTGRLLLGRPAAEMDIPEIIRAAAGEGVAIELNSNPARLDIDWRWGPELKKNQALVSINPDAHSLEGLRDTRFGVMMARKALLGPEDVLNSRSPEEVQKWLESP